MGIVEHDGRVGPVAFIAVVVVAVAVATHRVCWPPRPRTRPSSTSVTIGYSAWPGWFPLAVAEKEGIFKKDGLDVEPQVLRRLHLVARRDVGGQARRQHPDAQRHDGRGGRRFQAGDHRGQRQLGRQRRDHLRQVDQVGRRHEGQDGRGRGRRRRPLPAAPGPGQGGHDPERHRLPRRADRRRGGRFAGGQFDCVGVFAPFTLEALKRPGSHVVFSSKDFPGTIPDHIVVSQTMVAKQPKEAQKLVERLVRHARLHQGEPEEVGEDHGRRGRGLDRGLRGPRQRHEDLHRRRGAGRPSNPATRPRRSSTPPA